MEGFNILIEELGQCTNQLAGFEASTSLNLANKLIHSLATIVENIPCESSKPGYTKYVEPKYLLL